MVGIKKRNLIRWLRAAFRKKEEHWNLMNYILSAELLTKLKKLALGSRSYSKADDSLLWQVRMSLVEPRQDRKDSSLWLPLGKIDYEWNPAVRADYQQPMVAVPESGRAFPFYQRSKGCPRCVLSTVAPASKKQIKALKSRCSYRHGTPWPSLSWSNLQERLSWIRLKP